MKPNRFERSMRDTAPLKGRTLVEGSNLTKLSRSSGKIGMNCDCCGIGYETYACWAKRTKNHFCSKACANKAKEIPVVKACVECGGVMTILGLVQAERISTCSSKCRAAKRKKFLLKEAENMNASAIYRFGDHEKGVEISKKLDDERIKAIREDKRVQAAIAKAYGISQSHVSAIKGNRTWKHVKP